MITGVYFPILNDPKASVSSSNDRVGKQGVDYKKKKREKCEHYNYQEE